MADDARRETNGNERVGRLRLDYTGEESPADTPTSKSELPVVILTGIIAILVMVGALILILSGVFAR